MDNAAIEQKLINDLDAVREGLDKQPSIELLRKEEELLDLIAQLLE